MLAKNARAPRCVWFVASSLRIFASKLAPTVGEDRALLERFFTFGNLYFCRDSQWVLALIPFLRRSYESINTI